MEFPRAAPSGIPQTSLGFRGHLITNFPHNMVLLIIILFYIILRNSFFLVINFGRCTIIRPGNLQKVNSNKILHK